MTRWYRLELNADEQGEVNTLISLLKQRMTQRGISEQGLAIYKPEGELSLFFSPDAAALAKEHLEQVGAQSCDEPDLKRLKKLWPYP